MDTFPTKERLIGNHGNKCLDGKRGEEAPQVSIQFKIISISVKYHIMLDSLIITV